jgi:DNA-binding MarR family transcriptional regulator
VTHQPPPSAVTAKATEAPGAAEAPGATEAPGAAEAPGATEAPGAAVRVWATMQAFVTSQDRRQELREAFDFGRGLGRVSLLLKLTDGPMTLREIAESQGVDAPYATVIVDKLVGRGLAQRAPHPEDNRRKLVTLTDAGWDAAALAQDIMARPPAALAGLPPDDLAALERILTRLTT